MLYRQFRVGTGWLAVKPSALYDPGPIFLIGASVGRKVRWFLNGLATRYAVLLIDWESFLGTD